MDTVATDDDTTEDGGAARSGGHGAEGGFQLHTQGLGALPIINAFAGRLGLARLLAEHLPAGDGRVKLDPAAAIGLVVRNLLVGHRPVYALGEWAADFDPVLLGLSAGEP